MSNTRERGMGNRFSCRPDMVGLTMQEKKRIWNREYWAKARARTKEAPITPGGGSQAAKDAVAEGARYRRVICPPGIIGYPPDEIWWRTNDASFRRGLQAALEALKAEQDGC